MSLLVMLQMYHLDDLDYIFDHSAMVQKVTLTHVCKMLEGVFCE